MSMIKKHVTPEELIGRLAAIEQTLDDVDIDERVNILAYGIVGMIIMTCRTSAERKRVLRSLCDAMRQQMLPAMSELSRQSGPDSPLWPKGRMQ